MAAAFLAIGFVAAVLLACRSAAAPDGRRQAGGRLDLAATGMAAITFFAILMTRSRAGTVLAILAGTMAGLLTLRPVLVSTTRSVRWRILIGAGLCAAALLALASSELAHRFADTERVDEARFAVYRATLRIIADNSSTGVGIGRFGDVFPGYRSGDIPAGGIWDRAHNTYLQIAAEAGLPFLILALVPVLLVVLAFASDALSRNATPVGILGLCILTMPILHSLVDYPGQIPGYSIPLAVLSGLLFARGQIAMKPRSQPDLAR
jgi:O-antigen ligase